MKKTEKRHVVFTAAKLLVLIFILTGMTLSLPSLGILYGASAATDAQSGSDCTSKAAEDMHTKDRLLDNAKVLSMANDNADLKSMASGFVSKFNGMSSIWKLDLVNCKAYEL